MFPLLPSMVDVVMLRMSSAANWCPLSVGAEVDERPSVGGAESEDWRLKSVNEAVMLVGCDCRVVERL